MRSPPSAIQGKVHLGVRWEGKEAFKIFEGCDLLHNRNYYELRK